MTEDRNKIWGDYIEQGGQAHSIIKHSFTTYDRYAEASHISQWFIDQGKKLDFPILDFGCGVGDYGIYLLRQGAKEVDFYDYPRATNFVDYRLKIEKLPGRAINADEEALLWDYKFVIFGEVLEHLDNPLETLEYCLDNNTEYIFTSSYPYRSDDPDDPYWSNHDHGEAARLQMPECRKLLEDNYTYTKFEGELRLWSKK